jgi:hypothetical protein
MAVVLADGFYVVLKRPRPWPRDAHGIPVPPSLSTLQPTASLPGAAIEREERGTWDVRLDPVLWPVDVGDIIQGNGRTFVIQSALLRTNPALSDVDYIEVVAEPYPGPEGV